jgi:hypothetical protein
MRICLPAILLLVVASPVRGQSQCQLTGVWELVSGKVDGQPYPTGLHQRKFITRSHWAWVLRQDTDLKDLKTVADTLAAYRTRAGGSGTYTVQGTTYTEKIESFPEPAYEGLAVPFTCRVEGDRFYQSGTFPIMRDGKKVRDQMLEEVYRRIE